MNEQVRVTKSYKVAYITIQELGNTKNTKNIYDYIGEKMGIIQNGVVWIKITGQTILLCIVNFAIIAKIAGIAKI